MLKLSTKCLISAFNAQGSRGIIVAGQVGAVKIYVATVEPLRKKKDRVKLRSHQNWWFCEFHPLEFHHPEFLNASVLFCRFFFNLTLCMTKLRVLVLSFPDFTDISTKLETCTIVAVSMVELKWIVQWCQKCFHSGLHMILERKHIKLLSCLWVHHNVCESLPRRAEPTNTHWTQKTYLSFSWCKPVQTIVNLSSNLILNTNDDWHLQQQNVTLFRGVVNVVRK